MADTATTTAPTPAPTPANTALSQQVLLDQLKGVEALVTVASAADDDHLTATGTYAQAQKAAQVTAAKQTAAHQAVTDGAVNLIAAIKQHFHVP